MSDVKRICHMCGAECIAWCDRCFEAFETRTPAGEMSADERANELIAWGGPVEIPFPSIHKRIGELVGRPVWTHELAYFDALVAEVRSGNRASFAEVVGKVPPEKLIVARLEETVPDP